ncbi:MAG: four helix bundle protein [Elusimicrobiota bacterium]
MVKSFRELIVWKEAMKLAENVYKMTKDFPKNEIYGLTAQLQRSAVSVSANIAEGWARNSQPQFLAFLSHSTGSLAETESHIELAKRLGYTTEENANELFNNCRKTGFLLHRLIDSIK